MLVRKLLQRASRHSLFPGRTDGREGQDDDDDDPELEVGKEEKERYRTARDGDHLLAPFECDLCSFRNVQKRDPVAWKLY